ncbi:50S ribosomal protein L25/general stress protein Ctc [Reinekea blandensis]|uniref:Large ribosomal subunit protein bL25 n=1 Tax=Reinekea blandensis MED297 TaxID=314283 RepID=A4BI70_9GAMM|nr:50S ribosomal protein L25/general stress protein Ctc [Reinekea blandensis]EAR08213.1 ribosomal 5S rRNA E-loop binding protein Ctc/L25/TL5 [Reinekea sp. MED297] [Reinekea blandensis MED297]
MSTIYELNAVLREEHGKGASRRLRREKKVPAVIYGGAKNRKPQSLTLELRELVKAMENEAFFSHVLTINIGDKSEQAILMDVQRHPATDFPMHIDLERVTKSTVVHKKVPIHFVGEEKVEKSGAKALHAANELEITCKVGDLPEFIEVDVAALEVGAVLHLSELKLPKGVSLVELNKGEDHDSPVVSIVKAGAAASADEEDEAEDAAE